MDFTANSIIWTLVIGLVVGAIAKLLMPGKDPGGCIITILLGVAGAFVAAHPAVIETLLQMARSYIYTTASPPLLAADTDPPTAHDIAAAATWADKYRDANINGSREKTRQWHFVDIEIGAPNLDEACFNHPSIPAGTIASDGPAAERVTQS